MRTWCFNICWWGTELFVLHTEQKLLGVLEYIFRQCRKTIFLNCNFSFCREVFASQVNINPASYTNKVQSSYVVLPSEWFYVSRKHSAAEIPLTRFPFPKEAASWGLWCMALKKIFWFLQWPFCWRKGYECKQWQQKFSSHNKPETWTA